MRCSDVLALVAFCLTPLVAGGCVQRPTPCSPWSVCEALGAQTCATVETASNCKREKTSADGGVVTCDCCS
ncbi:hypothetical protein Cob_v009948 [Colletotrichum orbiculare MAFF 240422]|uniref:Secreted protein n=1 Tax=Colletotrichum orbiculare (strain 104-T / ATCC 96160 / CBS 514.97 / LARS 414 / MAFF 240422) TaxID=1213857 RepID=A0A484FI38_COLOR|nr:hypothetical protein Cob_v009948 [Colletotrichum orbiculare MAFF 240422]